MIQYQDHGVVEDPGSSSPLSASKLLKDALKLDKDVLVDPSHRGSQARKPWGKSCVIVAKLHYQDRISILWHEREFGPLRCSRTHMFVFQEFAPSVALDRAAINDVKGLLCGRTSEWCDFSCPAPYNTSAPRKSSKTLIRRWPS